MPRMIYAGASQDEALDRAAEELKLPREDLECEILEDNRDQQDVPEEERGVCVRVRVKQQRVGHEAAEILRQLIEKMGVGAQVEVHSEPDRVRVVILSPTSSILIGREGQTLDAIQHWLIRAVARVVLTSPRVVVDVEDYRQRKFNRLKRQARKIAEKVAETGEAVRLDPMGPVDRKFVHNALKDIEGVTTYSIGREGRRRVVISSEKAEGAEREHDDLGGADDERPEDEFLDQESAYQKLKVVATPTREVADEDEGFDEDLVEDFDMEDDEQDNDDREDQDDDELK